MRFSEAGGGFYITDPATWVALRTGVLFNQAEADFVRERARRLRAELADHAELMGIRPCDLAAMRVLQMARFRRQIAAAQLPGSGAAQTTEFAEVVQVPDFIGQPDPDLFSVVRVDS